MHQTKMADATKHVRAWMKRSMHAWNQVPFFTKATVVTCAGFHMLVRWNWRNLVGELCLSADSQVHRHEFGRILLAPLFHESWKHLLVNMVAAAWIGSSVEKLVGTLNLVYLNSILAIFGAVLYVIMAYVRANNPIKSAYIAPYECVAGMSGILFGQLAVECNMLGNVKRSLFGVVMIPVKLYPLVTLLAVWIILPGTSFTSHLSGLLVGTMYAHGMLDRLKLEGPLVEYVESSWPLRRFVQRSDYVAHESRGTPPASLPGVQINIFGWTMGYLQSFLGRARFFRRRKNNGVSAEDFPGEGHRLGSSDGTSLASSSAGSRSHRQGSGGSTSPGNLLPKNGNFNRVSPQDNSPREAFQDSKYEDKVAVLVEMGFDANVARDALEAAGGDVPSAAETLSR